MRTHPLASFAACLALGILSISADAQADNVGTTHGPLDAKAKALGTTVEASNEGKSGDTQWGRAIGVVDAPIERVMATVTNYERYDEFMPHFKKAKVLSSRGSSALVYMEASILKNIHTLWAQLKVKALPSRGTTQIVEAATQKSNMNQFAARWEVTPIEGGKKTLVDFRIIVEPKLPLPDSLFSAENKKAASKTIRALRKRVKSSK